MAFDIPSEKSTSWIDKMTYCEMAKRKLIEWARSNKNDIDENKFYSLLSDIDHERAELRRQAPAEFSQTKEKYNEKSKYEIKIQQIRSETTQSYKDTISLPNVAKAAELDGDAKKS